MGQQKLRLPWDGDQNRFPVTQNWGEGGTKYAWNNCIGGHPGVDIGIPGGTPLYAIADGVVIWAGPMEGFGDHHVVVWHPEFGVSSAMGHGEAHHVVVGQQVKMGDHLMDVDSQGWSTGSHLHWEIRPVWAVAAGNPPNIDPIVWFALTLLSLVHSEDHPAGDDMPKYAVVPITDKTHPGTVAMFKAACMVLNPDISFKNPVQTVEQVRSFLAAYGHPEVNDNGTNKPGMLTPHLQDVVYNLARASKNTAPLAALRP